MPINESVTVPQTELYLVSGSTQRAIYAQACESLRDTELGEVLSEVSEEDCEQFYRWYLNDFVRIVHKSKHKGHLRDMEHKVHIVPLMLNILVHVNILLQ